MTDSEAFRLSRIYAEGWNTARKLAPAIRDALDPKKMADLNPYAIEADRSRWSEGFAKALGD
jgi:hypothetical protein